MMNNWITKELGDIIELKYGKGLPKRSRVLGKYPVYGSGGIIDYHSEALIPGPGIIVGRKGSIGTVYYSEDDYYPIDTVFYVNQKENNNLKYLYYMLSQSNLNKLDSDAAVPGLNRNTAHLQIVEIPSIYIQNKIVSILGNYEDLIENNIKRITILEEMAQLIYKEWFVNYKYPGHKNDKMVDSEFGLIPEGWEFGKGSRYYNIKSGFAFKSKDMDELGEFGVVKIKNIQNKTVDLNKIQYIEKDKVDSRAWKFELQTDDILIAMTGATVGKVGKMPRSKRKFMLNQRVGKFFSTGDFFPSNYIYQLVISNSFRTNVINIAQGAAQPNISGQDIENIKILIPSDKITAIFEDICDPITREILLLNYKNEILRKSRDLLLPKLISGQIDVSEMDIDVSNFE